MSGRAGKPGQGAARRNDRNELVFLALGGLGEIGMNVYLYGFGPPTARQWLMVDLGVTFPGEAEPGVEVVLPDLRFIMEERQSLAGIVLTHAHEDHVGAVIDLWPALGCPVFATPFTAGMVNTKLAELNGRFKLPLQQVPLGGRISVGPFDVEFVSLAHSIPEPSGLAIRTPLGTVFHTGDWKLDPAPLIGLPSDEKRLAEIGNEGVLAVIGDSTNAFREGHSPSEAEIAKSLAKIIADAPRRVAVTTFASNVARIRAVADAAQASGRSLVIAGRALHRVISVAIETGYLPKGLKYFDQQEFDEFSARDVLVLCTGSQGEPRAALARISQDQHPDISLDKGDLVIFSSRTIPGNERAVGRIQNDLAKLGCDVLTDNEALVHVTGHPRRDELRQLYGWLRPRLAVPMHGEARHLKAHARLARECGVGEVFPVLNGEMLRIAPEARVIDDVPVGRLFRDGKLIVPDIEGPVRERRKLAVVGVVVVALALTRRGELAGEPQAAIDGVPARDEDGDDMLDIVLDAVDGTHRSIPVAKRKDHELIREAVRRAVRSAVGERWGKKPIVKVLINVVETKP
jgi:ribonuclease J